MVELTRRALEALNSRDIDVLMGFYAHDAVFDMTRTVGIAPQGTEAIRGFLEDWLVAYEEFEYELAEVLDHGNGVVLEIVGQKARPAGSTGFVRQREANVFLVADGLVVRQTVYPGSDIDEARAAAERLAEERG